MVDQGGKLTIMSAVEGEGAHTQEALNSADSIQTASEAELALLCLDYLRDLRRSYSKEQLRTPAVGLDGNYLTMACWALNRALVSPEQLTAEAGNDCFYEKSKKNGKQRQTTGFPTLASMEKELLATVTMAASGGEEKKDEDIVPSKAISDGSAFPYEYDDSARSNSHRFYPLLGLASGPALCRPLQLPEIVAVGLTGLTARSRLEAEKDMITSPLFDQFVTAVSKKGFFETTDDSDEGGEGRAEQLYEERYAKVVTKFRTKLAIKAMADQQENPDDKPIELMAKIATDHARQRREFSLEEATHQVLHGDQSLHVVTDFSQPEPSPIVQTKDSPRTPLTYMKRAKILFFGDYRDQPAEKTKKTEDQSAGQIKNTGDQLAVKTKKGNNGEPKTELQQAQVHNPIDLEEAENKKCQGNKHMQNKEFEKAVECYTAALKLSPAGPSSHVYFSNRAAAYVSMKKLQEARTDSERALALQPTYGKAHARLGLADFLLGNYQQALEAYTVALKYEPDNKSSQAYLEKAAKRLLIAKKQQQEDAEKTTSFDVEIDQKASFSIVSEWDHKKQQQLASSRSGSRNRSRGRSVSVPRSNSRNRSVSVPRSNSRNRSGSVPRSNSRNRSGSVPRSNSRNRSGSVPRSRSSSGLKERPTNQVETPEEQEAEKAKTRGNSHMAAREYKEALEAYSQAINQSPAGANSHLYFSNRAAALCYLERYQEAEADSVKSIQLRPTYGKAHARLGLSRFFLQDYSGAVSAYTEALKHDPENEASKSYLKKAKAKLQARVLENPDLRAVAARAMSGAPAKDLIDDPAMKNHAAKAMADADIMKAFG